VDENNLMEHANLRHGGYGAGISTLQDLGTSSMLCGTNLIQTKNTDSAKEMSSHDISRLNGEVSLQQ